VLFRSGLIEIEGAPTTTNLGPGPLARYLLDIGVTDQVAPRIASVTGLPADGATTDQVISNFTLGPSESLEAATVNARVYSYGGHFYLLDPVSASWTVAEAYAQTLGGHLATINDQAEHDWVKTSFGNYSPWIGFTDQAAEGTWVWASGQPVTYTRWNYSPGTDPNSLSSRQPQVKKYESPFANAKMAIDPDFWGPILFAAIGVLIFYYLYKKTNLFNKEQTIGLSPGGYITSSSLNDSLYSDPFYESRSRMPDNHIRKEIYQLEKFAQKKDLARLHHEAINEWLNRLGIDYDERTVKTYQQVRYGESAKAEIEEWFIEDVKSIKKQLTIMNKERKDANKSGMKNSLKNVFKK